MVLAEALVGAAVAALMDFPDFSVAAAAAVVKTAQT
jgi:hypothetical protein